MCVFILLPTLPRLSGLFRFWPRSEQLICHAFDYIPLRTRTSCAIDLHLGRVAYRQPLIYNAEVARELLKQVYVAERLQPPSSLATITDAYSVLWGRAKNPQYWRDLLTTGEWARVAVYAVEAYTIFKVSHISISRQSLFSFWYHVADRFRE